MSLLEDYERLMGEMLSDDDAAVLEGLTTFAVLAMDAGYELERNLADASRLELVARAAAARRIEVRRIASEGTASSGPMGVAEVLREVDDGKAGADLIAGLGLALAKAAHA